jgi:hypothetical protein
MTGTDPTMPAPRESDRTGALDERRGPDLLTAIVGLAALGIAIATLLGGMAWLPGIDGRWLLAILALTVGLLLVIDSLRPDKPSPKR